MPRPIPHKKHTNFLEEVDHHYDEDRWWKFGAIVLFICFIGYIVAHAVIALIF